jgi:Leu/Phe-tRNA-protein transferase
MGRTEQYSLILSKAHHVIHLTARHIGVVPGRRDGTTWKVYDMCMIILYSELHIKKKLRQLSSDIFHLHNLHTFTEVLISNCVQTLTYINSIPIEYI